MISGMSKEENTLIQTQAGLDLSFVEETVEAMGRGPEAAIPILQAIQKHYRYLPEKALQRVCELTEITPSQIVGVSTFYSQFRHRPAGEHIIRVCVGTACHVKDADSLHEAFRRHLHLSGDEDTSADNLFTVESVACLGCCTLAPVAQIDDVTYGHLSPDTIPRILSDFLAVKVRRAKSLGRGEVTPPPRQKGWGEIRISLDSSCIAGGSDKVYQAMERAVIELGAPAIVKEVGFTGMSYLTPLVEVVPLDGNGSVTRPQLYARVAPDDAKSIVLRHFKPKGIVQKLRNVFSRTLENLWTDEAWEPVTRYSIEVRDPPIAAFQDKQKRIATEHSGEIHPINLDEYLEHDGFKALERCLNDLTPEQVIEAVQRSGLRGRGGAGFPTGTKWSMLRQSKEDVKYIICNGDEGDPGAFMDRMLLESFPYRIIEGMAIAAYAVGATEGYFYIRAEYPLAVKRIREALRQCEARGFPRGRSGPPLKLRVVEGAGAFVCGEETALIASIEGKRGTPRLRPPYPTESGLWDKPTLINNVETFAVVPWIIRNGAEAFAAYGTEKSKGTKVFALAGKVVRGGLIEVPMGISIREIVEEIGGGPPDGKRFKAVQIGGPSGGCVPAELAHTPVDYESLTAVGAIMGSGGLVVLDESDCMVDIARYFINFTQKESCGKCTYCRIGTRRMLEILDRICEGQGKKSDPDTLEQLAPLVNQGSICGLGKTAPNPVLSTLKYFRSEYEAHLEKRCPAGKCKALITYSVTDACIGCTLCSQHCPADAIPMTPYQKHEINMDKCTRCDACRKVCPVDAVKVE